MCVAGAVFLLPSLYETAFTLSCLERLLLYVGLSIKMRINYRDQNVSWLRITPSLGTGSSQINIPPPKKPAIDNCSGEARRAEYKARRELEQEICQLYFFQVVATYKKESSHTILAVN